MKEKTIEKWAINKLGKLQTKLLIEERKRRQFRSIIELADHTNTFFPLKNRGAQAEWRVKKNCCRPYKVKSNLEI